MNLSALRIGEVALRAGVSIDTVRYYERRRLLPPVTRTEGGFRLFTPDAVERVRFIKQAQELGFSLDEIALMFAPDGRPRINRQTLTAKADELDRTIRKLSAMRDTLRHGAACPAPSHMECPTFRRVLRAAASGALGARRKTRRSPFWLPSLKNPATVPLLLTELGPPKKLGKAFGASNVVTFPSALSRKPCEAKDPSMKLPTSMPFCISAVKLGTKNEGISAGGMGNTAYLPLGARRKPWTPPLASKKPPPMTPAVLTTIE